MDSAIVCADIGTSSLKTALFSKTGAVISYKRKQISNAKNSWLNAFINSLKELLSDFSGKICAICIFIVSFAISYFLRKVKYVKNL